MQDSNTPLEINPVATPERPSGRRVRLALYVGLCLVASLAPLIFESARHTSGESGAAETIGAFVGMFALAVLTFPAGVVPVLLWWLLVRSGVATPSEGVAVLMPVFIAAGYLQWFVWIPKFVRRRSKVASS